MSVKFVDVYDRNRIIEPIEPVVNTKRMLCHIYYYDSNRRALDYGGKAEIPSSLIGESPMCDRMGFVPWKSAE